MSWLLGLGLSIVLAGFAEAQPDGAATQSTDKRASETIRVNTGTDWRHPRVLQKATTLSLGQALATIPPGHFHEAIVLVRSGTCFEIGAKELKAGLSGVPLVNGDGVFVLEPDVYATMKEMTEMVVVRRDDAAKALTAGARKEGRKWAEEALLTGSLAEKVAAVETLRQAGDGASARLLVQCLKENQLMMAGGTELHQEQRRLNEKGLAALGELTGVKFHGDATPGSTEVAEYLEKVDKSLGKQ